MKEKDKLWEKVKREFPKNPSLIEVYYARLKIQEETKGMSSDEYIVSIKARAKELKEKE